MPVPPEVDLSRELARYRLAEEAGKVGNEAASLCTFPDEQEDEEEAKAAQTEDLGHTAAPLTSNSANKPWMDYRAVTDTASTQYSIISRAYHRDDGLLEVDGYILVALGSYWGPVGTTYRAEIGGREVWLMKADVKQDCHTNGGYGYEGQNGHLVEVIVDGDLLDEMAAVMGDCDYLDALTGEITKLEVLE